MKKIILLFGFMLPLFVHAEVNVSVVPLSGNDVNFAIRQIGQIRFVDNSMCLYDKHGELLGCTRISEIGKMVFVDLQEIPTTKQPTSQNSILIYPNPVNSELIVHGVQYGQSIRVYSLQGHLIMSVSVVDNATVLNMSDLQKGDYLLQLGAEVVKIIKQ